MNKKIEVIKNNKEFINLINDLISNDTVQQMNNFRQHYDTSCFEHCLAVSYYSYLICKKLNLDYKSAARAGMLHDLFLYDWRYKQEDRKGLHAFTHPRTALDNSLKLFFLNSIEKDIILKHMWPVTIKLPKYKESYIVSCVDKYCALAESINSYKHNRKLQRIYRYAYIFLTVMLIRI